MRQTVVFINGWGVPEPVIQPFVERLNEYFDLQIINLPGLYKHSGHIRPDWPGLLSWLDQQTPDKPFALLGWSYGGNLASVYAGYTQMPIAKEKRFAPPQPMKNGEAKGFSRQKNITGLITLATNPCFVKGKDWEQGMDLELFASFIAGLEKHLEKQLYRFYNLCAIGSSNSKQRAKHCWQSIRRQVLSGNLLVEMLKLLGGSDIRSQLTHVHCPSIHFYGKGDALVPDGVGPLTERLVPHHKVEYQEGGHCFFLDNPAPVIKSIQSLYTKQRQ